MYLSKQDYNFIYSKVPRLCVDLVLRNKNGEILLSKRDIEPCKGSWHLPGGRVQLGENLNDAANRIAQAEIGAKIGIKGQLGICEFFSEKNKDGLKTHSVSIVLEADTIGSPKALDQSSEIKFFKKIPEKMVPEQRDFLLSKDIL
jgi:ADP-ribose pyrophosphatase YjhB (NUDIX family)